MNIVIPIVEKVLLTLNTIIVGWENIIAENPALRHNINYRSVNAGLSVLMRQLNLRRI